MFVGFGKGGFYERVASNRVTSERVASMKWQPLVPWSLRFKTTHSSRKYGLQLKVVLKWRDIYTVSERSH